MAAEGRPRLSCRSYGWNQYRLFDGTINGPTEEGLCIRLTRHTRRSSRARRGPAFLWSYAERRNRL